MYNTLKLKVLVLRNKYLEQSFINISNDTQKLFESKNYPLTYGELTLEGMKQIFNDFDTNQKKIIDLGSGLGKIPLMAILYFNFSKATGVELSIERHLKAMEMYKDLPEENKKKIEYINDDLFNINIFEYDYIFVSNLCFSDELNEKLQIKLENESKKDAIIILSKPFNSNKFKLLQEKKVNMTWNKQSKIHLYIKI